MSDAAAPRNANAHIRENYFESNYPPLPLPMIWRVIYHEAVRGNHILWDSDDLAAIDQMHVSADMKMSDADRSAVTSFMVRFISGTDFRQLSNMIKELTMDQKAVAFILYRRAIHTWQRWLKTNLH